jgi:hypothetical protein
MSREGGEEAPEDLLEDCSSLGQFGAEIDTGSSLSSREIHSLNSF